MRRRPTTRGTFSRTMSLGLLLTAGISARALACACCSEPGMRFETTEKISDYTRGELALMRFQPTAKLVTDAGFPDTVKGVAAPSDKGYQLIVPAIRREVVINLTEPGSTAVGQITFPLPRKNGQFQVDPGNGGKSPAGLTSTRNGGSRAPRV
jgi:hypothetical protein